MRKPWAGGRAGRVKREGKVKVLAVPGSGQELVASEWRSRQTGRPGTPDAAVRNELPGVRKRRGRWQREAEAQRGAGGPGTRSARGAGRGRAGAWPQRGRSRQPAFPFLRIASQDFSGRSAPLAARDGD